MTECFMSSDEIKRLVGANRQVLFDRRIQGIENGRNHPAL